MVRVVSALAMLAATTSARIRSACMALPEVSINPKRFIQFPFPGRLFAVGMDGVKNALILLLDERHAGFELQLRLGKIQALAVH